MDFTVADVAYRTTRPDARAQFKLLRRVHPILPALSAFGLAVGSATTFSAVAALATADEAATGAALDGCMALVERWDGEAWHPFGDAEALSLQDALSVVAHVVAVNFGPYFDVQRPDLGRAHSPSIRFEPVFLPDAMDWLYRPMMRGLCRYESLVDGTLHIEDVAEMNAVLDATDENQRRAGDAAAKEAQKG